MGANFMWTALGPAISRLSFQAWRCNPLRIRNGLRLI
jgi:hypothetical protein